MFTINGAAIDEDWVLVAPYSTVEQESKKKTPNGGGGIVWEQAQINSTEELLIPLFVALHLLLLSYRIPLPFVMALPPTTASSSLSGRKDMTREGGLGVAVSMIVIREPQQSIILMELGEQSNPHTPGPPSDLFV